MDLPGKVKDIDIAIMMDAEQFLGAVKQAFIKEYFKFTTSSRKQMPVGYSDSISNSQFADFLSQVKALGRQGTTPNGEKITGEMWSALRAYKNGLLKDSKFLSKAEKSIRNSIVGKYGLEIDLSVILGGGVFDKGPFLQLLK